jgi:hypothetical protein
MVTYMRKTSDLDLMKILNVIHEYVLQTPTITLVRGRSYTFPLLGETYQYLEGAYMTIKTESASNKKNYCINTHACFSVTVDGTRSMPKCPISFAISPKKWTLGNDASIKWTEILPTVNSSGNVCWIAGGWCPFDESTFRKCISGEMITLYVSVSQPRWSS